jgi:transposase-like protein
VTRWPQGPVFDLSGWLSEQLAELAIPKLRHGSYFPDWLLARRRRAEAALVSVLATSYVLGVSTRRMEKLVETLGITRHRHVESRMRGNAHVRFGGRPAETDQPQGWHRAAGRPNQERLNREIRRRTDVVGIFPDRTGLIRLVGAVLAEQHDECTEMRRSIGLDVLTKSRHALPDNTPPEEVTLTAITA